MKTSLEGIFPPVTTPFDSSGEVDYQAFRENLEKYCELELSGVLILGSTGESVHLTETERLELVRVASETVPDDKKLIVGVSNPALRQNLHFLSQIEKFRIDSVLVSVPAYYKNRMNGEALRNFFFAIAESSRFPVLLYNIPQYSGIELGAELVRTLAEHDRIVGMKDSSGNLIYLQGIQQATRDRDFEVVGGSAETMLPAWILGLRAGIFAVACVVPQLVLDIAASATEKRSDASQKQAELFRISFLLVKSLGIAGIKYAMDLMGFRGGEPRAPLLPLSADQRNAVESVLEQSMPIKTG
ncbi:MAG TPA: dihydrodipicolinate synthase family protein [Acidobacteriota bacterium]|nr:dihydrodipicolinate synthase family protein [Acidobacteriota bacterium]